MDHVIILPQPVGCLFTSLVISLDEQFLIIIKSSWSFFFLYGQCSLRLP